MPYSKVYGPKMAGIGKGTPGPGRPKNGLSKKTRKRIDLAMKVLNGPETPLEIMLEMARGEREFNAQILEACKAAAPYVHPKLVAMKVDATVRQISHEEALDQLDDLEPEMELPSSMALLGAAMPNGYDEDISRALEAGDDDE